MIYDCVIVGAGAVGASLALVLGQLKYRVLLLEQTRREKILPQDNFALSTLGLSYSTVFVYSAIGIWSKLASAAVPIKQVEVSVQNQFGQSRLLPAKGQPYLGQVISVKHLEAQLYEQLIDQPMVELLEESTLVHYTNEEKSWNLTVQTPSGTKQLCCRLLVGADGANSWLRKIQGITSVSKIYQHYAILANIRIDPSLNFTAIERFLKNGAIALLPWKDNIATCVWTVSDQELNEIKRYSEEDYLKVCQRQLGQRFGRVREIGKRLYLPLQMQLAQNQISSRFLLMGNAAHSIHPIAAQGFNLSMRDIWQLRKQILKQRAHCDIGASSFLEEYIGARQKDQARVIFATDKIARFMSGGPLPNWLRAMGMTIFDCTPPLKHLFTRYSMGFAG